eukprot:595427_1
MMFFVSSFCERQWREIRDAAPPFHRINYYIPTIYKPIVIITMHCNSMVRAERLPPGIRMEVDNSSCGMAKVGFSDADAPSSVFPSIRSLSPTKPIQTWYFSLEIPLPSQQSPPHGPQPTQPHGQRTPPHIQIYCTIIMIKLRRTQYGACIILILQRNTHTS